MLIPDLAQWLEHYLLPVSLTEATNYLKRLDSAVEYIQCYQHFFPAAYERSLQSTASQQLLPPPGEAYSIPEQHFLQLVNAHLFPIPEWVFFDSCEENRCDCVPLESTGFASLYESGCVEDDAEGMDLGWQLLLYLQGWLEPAFFFELLDECDPANDIFEHTVLRGDVDAEILKAHCERCPEPLRSLPLALDILDLDTRNPWLDTTCNTRITVPWEPAAVAQLAAQWRASQVLWEQAMCFIRWIEDDVSHHFMEVIALWNQCRQETDALPQAAPSA